MEATSDLTKVTVYLTPRSWDALCLGAAMTELSKTDTINRALQLYGAVQSAANDAVKLGNEHGVALMFDELAGDDFNFEVRVRFVPEVAERRWWRWGRWAREAKS